jgi:hypothetical protein
MNKISRRELLKTSAAYGGFLILSRLARGREKKSANSTLNVALIGGGGIAKTCFGDCDDENVVAIADVDDVSGAEGFKRFPQAKRCKDFRRMLDQHGKKPSRGAGTYVYEFAARGGKPPVSVYWYEGGHMPRFPDALKAKHKIPNEGGCLLIGSKNTLYSPGMRPTSPSLMNDWDAIRREGLPPKTTPRAVGNPVKELFTAIRGGIPKCGSNFDYAVPLTEMVILGTVARRSGKTVEYIPEKLGFKDASLNPYIKEPVRQGWEYGEGLLG